MNTREQGLRRAGSLTNGLVVASVAGSAVAGALAYTATHSSTATAAVTPTTTSTSSTSSTPSGGFRLSPGRGPAHATTSGS